MNAAVPDPPGGGGPVVPDPRAAHDRAFREARLAAFEPGQYVGQESFMRADAIRELARRAGIRRGTEVLDLCCGVAGPGRLIATETGCRYLGVDASGAAIAIARERSTAPDSRFLVGTVPPVPAGSYDVVLLLETILAFREKNELVTGIAGALRASGRFACTVEEGPPLTERERAVMPAADTVWPIRWNEFETLLRASGLQPEWVRDCSREHLATVDALIAAVTARRSRIAAEVGVTAVDELLAGHRCWSRWLRAGRIRKFAVVAQRR